MNPKFRDWIAFPFVLLGLVFLLIGQVVLYVAGEIGGPFMAKKLLDLDL